MSLIDKCYYLIRNDTRYTSMLYECILSVDETDDINDDIKLNIAFIIFLSIVLSMFIGILICFCR